MDKIPLWLDGLGRLFETLDLVQAVMWVLIWYMVYYLSRHRFVLLLLAGNTIDLLLWLYSHRYLVLDKPAGPIEHSVAFMVVLNLLYKASSLCLLIGAAFGLRYLQKLMGEKLACEKSN